MSKESETLLSVVLTDCPPGPEERENFQDSSDAGITIPRRISRSSAMVASMPNEESARDPAHDQCVRGWGINRAGKTVTYVK